MRIRDWVKLVPLFGKSLLRLPWRHIRYMTRRLRYEILQSHAGRIYVNTFLPPLPSPAFDRLLDALIQRKRVPFSTYFALTDQCPYQCPHCSYGAHQAGQVDTAQALDIIGQIKDLGTTSIGFSGGEPLLRDDLPELVRSVGPDTESILFTTGYGLDSALAEQLKGAGLRCMMIGLEADNADAHDRVRSVTGSFQTAMDAISLALQTGFYTAISTVATHEKLHSGQIRAMAELAFRLGVQEFRILEPVPTGRALGQVKTLISEEDRRELTALHKQWNRQGRPPTIASFSYLESAEMFGCGAGYHHLYVDAVGNVSPCDLTPLSFGNALNEPLADIWQRMGTHFGRARCGCFAQAICSDLGLCAASDALPLDPAVSDAICREHPAGELPQVYTNLTICQIPADPGKIPE